LGARPKAAKQACPFGKAFVAIRRHPSQRCDIFSLYSLLPLC
jgi:hypothetical protein